MITTNSYDEGVLLQQVATGDEQAFTKLFYHWQAFLSTHIYRITESRALTEEIVQDVFLKIWQTRESLPEIQNFKSYLLVVSKNHALNALKKVAKEFEKKQQWLKEGFTTDDADASQALYNLLDEAIDQLSERQREVYLMHRHQRLSYQEIADVLGIGKETVKTHIEVAVKHINRYVRGKLDLAIIFFLLQG